MKYSDFNLFKMNDIDRTRIDMLFQAFRSNIRLTNMLRRPTDLKKLLIYAYKKVRRHGGIFVSEDQSSIILFYRGLCNQNTISDLLRYLYLAVICIKPSAIINTVLREKKVKKVRAAAVEKFKDKDYIYVWFLAAYKNRTSLESLYQLKRRLFKSAQILEMPIYIETIEKRLVQHYERLGFVFYTKQNLNGITIWFGRYLPQPISYKIAS